MGPRIVLNNEWLWDLHVMPRSTERLHEVEYCLFSKMLFVMIVFVSIPVVILQPQCIDVVVIPSVRWTTAAAYKAGGRVVTGVVEDGRERAT